MTIKIECPSCGSSLNAPDRAAGKTLKCPHCDASIAVAAVAADTGSGSDSGRRKPCPMCGESIAESAVKCRFCHSMLVTSPPVQGYSSPLVTPKLIHPPDQPRSPLLMAMLSGCCIAGLGQMVLGQVVKGVAVLIGSVVLAVVTAGISALVVWPLMGLDAYLIAKKLQTGQAVTEWESFPAV